MEISKRVEKFIQDYTRNCSNVVVYSEMSERGEFRYHEWLTPDQARRAVEIAREEVIKRACSFIADNIGEYIELKHANPTTFIEIDGDRFVNDFKQAMKDET